MDDPGGSTYRLLIIVSLFAVSAILTGLKTALLALTPVKVRQLQEKGAKEADLLSTWLDDGQRLLSALLIGNTIVIIGITGLIADGMLSRMDGAINPHLTGLLATLATAVSLLIFTEIGPKVLGAMLPERFLLLLIKPAKSLYWVMRPVIATLDWITVGKRRAQGSQAPLVTEENIKTAVNLGEEEGRLRQEDRDMIYGIFASDDTPISRVMVPRKDIAALSIEASINEAIELLQSKGYSRLPVYRRDLDHVVGMIYAKDILTHLYREHQTELADLIRPVMRCRSNRPTNQLLTEMRAKRTQLCLVVDESGRTVGLVTLEDLLEEIVGEIVDEYDQTTDKPAHAEVASC